MKGIDYWLRVGFCLLAALLAGGAIALTLMMNNALGASFGATTQGQFIQSYSLMLVDCMGVVMTIGAGFCLRSHRMMLPIVGALAIVFGIYSLIGVVGFGAKERIAKSQAIEIAQTKNDQAIAAANTQSLKERDELLKWAKSSAVEANGRSERLGFADRAIALSKAPIQVIKFDEKNEVAPDAQAQVLTDVWNAIWFLPTIASDKMQFCLVLGLAILLKLAEMGGFFVASAMWPRRETKGETKPEAKGEEAPSDMALSHAPVPAVVTQPVTPAPIALQAHIAATTKPTAPATVIKPHIVGQEAREQVADMAYHRDLALVRRFKKEMMREAPTGFGAERADKVYAAFVAWAQTVGATGDMKQARFGACLTDLGIERFKKKGYVHYRGIDLALAA